MVRLNCNRIFFSIFANYLIRFLQTMCVVALLLLLLLQTCLIRGCPNEQKIAHQTLAQKKCFKLLLECLMAFKFYQTRPNTIKHDHTHTNRIKQHQTRCPNGKLFGHQTMFDGVWSPNIYRLSRPSHFSLSITEWIVSSVANQRKALVIEH